MSSRLKITFTLWIMGIIGIIISAITANASAVTMFVIMGSPMFIIQLIFCLKLKRKTIKLIPVYAIILAVLVLLNFLTNVLLYRQGGFGASIVAAWVVYAIGSSIICDVMAWLTYIIIIETRV